MRSPTEGQLGNRDRRLAVLVACAAALQVLESQLPFPVPGVRLGLANAATLVALADLGFAAAVEVALLRTVAGSLVLGTFLTPAFVLSLAGAAASAIVMGGARAVLAWTGRPLIGLIGLSVLGSFAHTLAQLVLVATVVVRHPGVFALLPLLGATSTATGWLSGLVAASALRTLWRMRSQASAEATPSAAVSDEDEARGVLSAPCPASWLAGVSTTPKLLAFLAASFAAASLTGLGALGLLFGGLVALAATAPEALRHFVRTAWRLPALLLFFLVVPALFSREGLVLSEIGPILVTDSGLLAGGAALLRLLTMGLAASLVVATSHPSMLAEGLARPFDRLGERGQRLGRTLSLAVATAPAIWGELAPAIRRTRDAGLRSRVRDLIPVFAHLYEGHDRRTLPLGQPKPADTGARL
jgi:heptaprenyl diphosphate synthase